MSRMSPPENYEDIRKLIKSRYPDLSNRLQQIAKFALDHPTDIAIETIATISERAKVQPSALIRFSKAFGYSGFSAMQRAFQSRVVKKSASYKERIREIKLDDEESSIHSLMNLFCSANKYSLEELQKKMGSPEMEQALALLKGASHVFVAGQRRAFPVAAYLTYSLNHAGAKTFLLDGVGGMHKEYVGLISKNDVLIGITYAPYAEETRLAIESAKRVGAGVLLITDSSLCPSSKLADICLSVHDAEVHSFKSLTASMCVSQVLATALAFSSKDEPGT